jgi:hypothetical protein
VKPPKGGQVSISYPGDTERFREDFCVELRVPPRARDRTHIDQQINRYLPEQVQKLASSEESVGDVRLR